MKKSSLVIFDCDGVLVDTEQAANKSLTERLNLLGWDISYEACRRRFVGKSLKSVQAEVEVELGRNLAADWDVTIEREEIEVFRHTTEAIVGVEAQVMRLRDLGIPYCVASSGRIEKMHATLGSAGLLPVLKDVLFSATMVKNGKPAPDLFLHAASAMGYAPETCIVIEDSRPGVEAGVAAGMRVLGYAGDPLTDRAALETAGATVFENMRHLPKLLDLS
ncbi:MAG: HAD-IA family hydrolase [Parvibaculaceae bacterium]|nr:HAD-IA family hydrolase [Parvibaculaceae bacterium]